MLAYRGELDPHLPLDETLGALGGTFAYPFQYGYGCVGEVEESRSSIATGELVFAFHPHQDRFTIDAADAIRLGSLGAREATLLPLVETALQIALDAGPLFGETVIVYGLGTVGALTSLVLGRAGARTIAVEPQPWRRDIVGALGVEVVSPEALADVVGDTDVSLAVEVSGNPAALRSALGVLAHEGTVLVASWYGTKEATLPLGAAFHRRRLTIRSTQVSTIPAGLTGRWNTDRRRRAAVAMLSSLPVASLATHTFAFEDAGAAYAALDSGTAGVMHAALGYW